MAKDFTVILEHRPGTLAELGEALGAAGINIEGISATICEGQGVVHVLVEDAEATRRVLQEKGFTIREERDVVVISVPDRPGELGRVCRRLADAGVNLDLVYVATNTRLVFGTPDLEKARAVLAAEG